MAQEELVVCGGIAELDNGLARDHQEVRGGLGAHIFDGDAVLILPLSALLRYMQLLIPHIGLRLGSPCEESCRRLCRRRAWRSQCEKPHPYWHCRVKQKIATEYSLKCGRHYKLRVCEKS